MWVKFSRIVRRSLGSDSFSNFEEPPPLLFWAILKTKQTKTKWAMVAFFLRFPGSVLLYHLASLSASLLSYFVVFWIHSQQFLLKQDCVQGGSLEWAVSKVQRDWCAPALTLTQALKSTSSPPAECCSQTGLLCLPVNNCWLFCDSPVLRSIKSLPFLCREADTMQVLWLLVICSVHFFSGELWKHLVT